MLQLALLFFLAIMLVPGTNLFSEGGDPSSRSAHTNHSFDLLHVRIEVTLDYNGRSVTGRVHHVVRLLEDSIPYITVDADPAMAIGRVTINGELTHAELDSELLRIAVGNRYRLGDTLDVVVPWSVKPSAGLYFMGSGTSESPEQVWTQGQDNLHHHWVPIYDRPDDLTTSEVIATVPSGWKVLSNGEFRSTTANDDGTTTWWWAQRIPHATYLITMAAGPFHVARDTVDGLPLEYWVAPADSANIPATFGRTPRILRFLTSYLGVPYPWNKYAQVVVADFMHGGMENTNATTLTTGVIVEPGSVDYSPDGVIAHEIAHQWFGDLVTNRDWRDRWLHESFAEYLELRALQDLYGDDRFIDDYRRHRGTATSFDRSADRSPLVGPIGATANIYYRGAVILHMLNRLIGDDAFRLGCRLFLERNRHANVETEDLRRAFEAASGHSLELFFRQWIYGAGHPVLSVTTDLRGTTLIVNVDQKQPYDSTRGLFTLDLPISIACVDGRHVDTTVAIRSAQNRFEIALPAPPRYTAVDPDWTIFKELEYRQPVGELLAMLAAPRPTVRIDGATGIQIRDTGELRANAERHRWVTQVMFAYQHETSPTIREELLRAAAHIGGPTQYHQILTHATSDTARDVRRTVIELADQMPEADLRMRLLRPFLDDVSDVVASEALVTIVHHDTSGLEPTLRRLKGVRGRRGRVADVWLSTVMAGHFTRFIDDVAEYTRSPFGTNTSSYAFDVLGALGQPTGSVVAAIEHGLRSDDVIIRAAAAICTRKLMGPEVRAMLTRLRNSVSGDQRATVEALLRDEEH